MKNKRYLLVAIALLLLTLGVSAVAFADYTSLTFDNVSYETNVYTGMSLDGHLTKVGSGDLVWTSSDAQIASVSSYGYVSAGNKVGTVIIYAADKNNPAIAAACYFTVKDQPVTAITFKQASISLKTNGGINLSSFVKLTQAAGVYSTGDIVWTSNDQTIATVTSSGYVSGVDEGVTTVTATITNCDGTVATADIPIYVTKAKLTAIRFARAAYTVKYGASDKKLQLITAPVSVTGYSNDLTYESSDITIATVSSNGYVHAVKPGTVTITATYNPDAATVLTAQTTVTVTSKPIKKITLSKKSLTVVAGRSYVGDPRTVSFSVEPAGAYWDAGESYWESSDEELFTVDGGTYADIYTYKTGKGTLTVYVFDGTTYHKASCSVEITTKKTGITLNKTKLSIPLKKVADEEVATLGERTLTAFNAETGNTLSGVKWTSSNKKVATVTKSGVVKAVKAGSAVITATAPDGSTAKCKVTVKQYKVTSISGPKTITIRVSGAVYAWDYLTVKPLSKYLYNPIYTFSSSNDDVASVNDNGYITGNSVGTATITAKAGDGSKKSFSFKVKVIKQAE